MRLRHVIIVAAVVGLLVPVAGASVTPASTPSDERSTAADSDGGSGETADPANVTRLYIEDRFHRLRIKPGERESVTVTVVNTDEAAVEIEPQLVSSNPRSRVLDDDWVTVEPAETTLDPDASVDVTVTVDIPDGAELGDYSAQLALTDERIAYPGRPARPVHAAQLDVDVWREPTVRVLAGRHVNTQVEAGGSYTHEVVVENTGEEAVPVSPELETDQRGRCYEPCPTTVERSWFEVDAPAEIAAGATETIEVTIAPPDAADRGRYRAELDLGLKDPARAERDDHWQQIGLGFQVWKQPDEPFETTVGVSEEATSLTLTLSPRQPSSYRDGEATDAKPPRFDIEFVSPDGEVVRPERVRIRDNGFVDLSGERREVVPQGDYAVRSGGQQFVYRIDEPQSGTWTARIMPHNTVGFGYEFVREESGR